MHTPNERASRTCARCRDASCCLYIPECCTAVLLPSHLLNMRAGDVVRRCRHGEYRPIRTWRMHIEMDCRRVSALSINWGVANLRKVLRRLMLSINSRMPYSVIPSKPSSEHARRRRCKALSSWRIPAHKNMANAHRNGLPARERFVNKLGRREPVQGVATPLLRSSFADIGIRECASRAG